MIQGYILESKGEREREGGREREREREREGVRDPVVKDIPHKQMERICVHAQKNTPT